MKRLAPHVIADAAVCFGYPVIEGTGISTQVVASRFIAGESVADLAREYAQPPEAIEDALRYEWAEELVEARDRI